MMSESTAESIQGYPWNLKPQREYSFSNCSSNLSFDFKRVALEASASVVGILSCLGETKVVRGSGFVLESTLVDDKIVSTIITSAYVLRPEADINNVADNIKISVILFNDITCEGNVFGWDFHYNIGVIKIETNIPIPSARLRHVNDSINIDPNLLDEKPPKFHPQSNKFNLVPGDTVVALGRYHIEGYGLTVVAGKFSVNKTGLDCQELLRAEFEISRFFELIWDKVGQSVHLDVLRSNDGSRWDVTVMVGNVGPNQFNRWPLPRIRKRARDCWLERLRQARA